MPAAKKGKGEASAAPAPPALGEIPADHPRRDLWRRVRETLFALPSRFQSDLVISGVLATDLHTFNTSLGATIETQVVDNLNELRNEWDPEEEYVGYSFERQPQTFPDVLLKASALDKDPQILLGVELKGWYVLAKEREPSYRFKTTPAVCATLDLLVVFPWALSSVVSGSPQLFAPFVVPARYAALYRNWYWEHGKESKGDTSISLSTVAGPYPAKSDQISDKAASDGGGNFGRIARAGIMDEYVEELFREDLLGIPLDHWQRFFRLFKERNTAADITHKLDVLASKIEVSAQLSEAQMATLRGHFAGIADLLANGAG